MARQRNSLAWLLGGLGVVIATAMIALMLLDADTPPPEAAPMQPAARDSADPGARPDLPKAELVAREPAPPPARRVGGLEGRVVRPDRAPVPGARVEVFQGSSLGIEGLVPLDSLGVGTTSDASGRFRMADLPAHDQIVLKLDGDTFAITESGPHAIQIDGTTDVGEIVVDPGLTLRGRVYTSNGQGVVGAQIEAHGGLVGRRGTAGLRPVRIVLSGERGDFEIPHLPPHSVTLFASADGHARAWAEVEKDHEDVDSAKSVSIMLPEPTELRGLVLDTNDVPLAGMRVEANPHDMIPGGSATVTDELGRFVFRDLALGAYGLRASGDGHAPGEASVLRRMMVHAEEIVIRLEPSGSIRGSVVTPAGEPVPFFDLLVRRSDVRVGAPAAQGSLRRTRDSGGAFHIEDLNEGWYSFEVWSQGYALTITQPVHLKQGQHREGAVVTLQPGAVLRGRVVDDGNAPVADAQVSLLTNRQPDVDFIRATDVKAAWLKSTRTDADGVFELTDVTPRVYQVEVDHPDYPKAHRHEVVALSGETNELEPFVLERAATVQGVVRSASGQALPNVMVSIGGGRVIGRRVRSNARGEYVFERLPPGHYVVQAIVNRPDLGRLLQTDVRRAIQSPTNPFLDEGVTVEAGEVAVYNVVADG